MHGWPSKRAKRPRPAPQYGGAGHFPAQHKNPGKKNRLRKSRQPVETLFQSAGIKRKTHEKVEIVPVIEVSGNLAPGVSVRHVSTMPALHLVRLRTSLKPLHFPAFTLHALPSQQFHAAPACLVPMVELTG
ncbi:hypothetical protein [Janthinobacterium kumbetense]|uniref:Uncharacterized protein n=1 Tax=Janthinobacterium kumbetense TaxID=2950280 RepID=A0ABT0WIZ9_9BURK|nr:hypothetical protein [Janthinobacterium kumbetense]MCM2564035.1 hypothetical protein [Janthinobacterium kumbetense]